MGNSVFSAQKTATNWRCVFQLCKMAQICAKCVARLYHYAHLLPLLNHYDHLSTQLLARRCCSALLFWTVCSKHTIYIIQIETFPQLATCWLCWLVPFSSNKSGAKTCSGGVPVKKKWLTRSQEPAFNVYIAILWVMNGSSNAERVFGLHRPLRPGWTFWPRDLSEKSPPKYPNVSGTAASFQK